MKKTLRTIMIVMLAFFMLTGSVWAVSYTYNDNTINWPGWTPGYTQDQIGIPAVSSLTVTVNDDNYLETIVINMTDRQAIVDYWMGIGNGAMSWDALFIKTGLTSQDWDYYVEDTTGDNTTGASLYNVGSVYTYKLATQYSTLDGRWGHPAGISDGDADTSGLLVSVEWDTNANTLTYTFKDDSILLGQNFVIGYSEWCANDVFLTPVPEPGILLLLGLGFLAVGTLKRRMK